MKPLRLPKIGVLHNELYIVVIELGDLHRRRIRERHLVAAIVHKSQIFNAAINEIVDLFADKCCVDFTYGAILLHSLLLLCFSALLVFLVH